MAPGNGMANPTQDPFTQLAMQIQSISVILDIGAISLTFWIAYELICTNRIGPVVPVRKDTLEVDKWAMHAFVAILITLTVFTFRGVYQVRRKNTWADCVPPIITSFGISIAAVVLLASFIHFSPSRAVYVYVLVFGTMLLLGHRAISHVIRTRKFGRGIGRDRSVIFGETEHAWRVAQSLVGQPQWG